MSNDPTLVLMVMAAAADGEIEKLEVKHIVSAANYYPYLKSLPSHDIFKVTKECQNIMSNTESKEAALIYMCNQIPDDRRKMAFALCFDVLASNFVINEPESRFIKSVKDYMNISSEFAQGCELSVIARYFFETPDKIVKSFT